MTFIQAFDKISERINGNAKITTDKDFFAVQVQLTNKDCSGIFYIKYEYGNLSIEPYDYRDNSVAISLSYLTFNKLIDGRIDVASGIASGNIDAVGDLTAAEAICSIVPEEEKPVTKKAVPAKTENAKAETEKPKAKKPANKSAKTDSKKTATKKTAAKKK